MTTKIVGVCILGVIALLLAMTIPTTTQLAKMDIGLRSSVHSTKQLVLLEQDIIQKNKSLNQLVATAHDMNRRMQETKDTTAALDKNIQMIDRLNQSTLSTNQQIAQGAKTSADHLKKMAASMNALDRATKRLSATLSALNGIVKQDNADLSQMKQATDAMNSKIPGVLG